MTVFHFFNCAILTFGPHAVYYSATPLSEYDTLGTSVKAALVYLGTALVKLVCLATFLKVSDNESFDPYQEFLKALIGFIDVAGLYFALTQLTHRNISQNHKFQAVGLGWAFADSVLHRLAPLWVGARGLEFTWDYILQGLEANANLLSEARPGLALSRGCRVSTLYLSGHGLHQLAALCRMSETFCLKQPIISPNTGLSVSEGLVDQNILHSPSSGYHVVSFLQIIDMQRFFFIYNFDQRTLTHIAN
ncbi:unnamed protein product [Prunus armeniaca]|uniref:BOS complex subunit TMEM147 n=1 Tax=Prunus armeniaca TaxID=36596 RepID=A0A6J5WDL0_PRUAR|nr:unnamed protein product [Prunus armeniaca]